MFSAQKLKNIILTGIFIIPFIGLLVLSSFYFPYITPKNLAFRAIVLICSAFFVFLIYKSKEYRPTFGTVSWAFLIFVIILFVADLFGQFSYKSFFSNFERMEGFFTILLLFFYYLILNGVLKSERIWENLFNTVLGAGVLMDIFAFVEKSHGTDRLAAQLGNATYLAAFMLFNLFLGLYLLVRHLDRKDINKSTKWLKTSAYIIIILLDLYVFYNTGTRGAILGFGIGLFIASILFAFFEKHNRKLKITGYTLLIIVVVSAGSLFIFRNSSFVKSSSVLSRLSQLVAAPTDLSQYFATAGKSRLSIWKIAGEGVKERPILGWGQENFNYVFNKYYDPKIYDQEQWFDRAHNVFFDWLISGGILGLLSYLSIFFFGIYAIWKKSREDQSHHLTFADKTILSTLLIAYFIHNFFVFDNITSYILFFTVLSYISRHEKPLALNKNFSFLKTQNSQRWFAPLFSLATLFGLYYLVLLPYFSSTRLISALTYVNTALSNEVNLNVDQRNKILSQALENFQKVLQSGVIIGKAEAREMLTQNSIIIVRTEGINTDIKKSYTEAVTSEMEKQFNQAPEDARYFYLYANYLSSIGEYDQSYSYFEKAEKLSPNKQSILIAHGLAYINAKKFGQGLLILKNALDLAPENEEARMFYAAGLIYAGDNKTAEQVLEPIRETDYGTNIQLMRAYYATNQPEKIKELLQIKLEIAQKLWKEGNKQGAINEIQEVVSIDPSFKAQGDALIKQIQESK